MMRGIGKIIAGFLAGAIAFIGVGAYGAFNPQAPAIPLAEMPNAAQAQPGPTP